MVVDISADMRYVDGLVDVLLFDPQGTAYRVPNTMATAVGVKEAEASRGAYRASDTVFSFAVIDAPRAPAVGDKIRDDCGSIFEVIEAPLVALRSRYRCICRAASVEGFHSSLVTIWRNEATRDAYGAPVRNLVSREIEVRARIQPIDTTERLDVNQRRIPKRFVVWFDPSGGQFELTGADYVDEAGGRLLRVLAVRGREMLGMAFGAETIEEPR